MLASSQTDRHHDRVFDDLKAAVRDDSMKKHQWDEKAEDSLVHLSCLYVRVLCFSSHFN